MKSGPWIQSAGGGRRRPVRGLRCSRVPWVIAAGVILGMSPARTAGFEERFDAGPVPAGWEVHGQSDLFKWDAAREALSVTWDSSKPNSYFLRRLPSPVTERDDFAFGFDLELATHRVGVDAAKPGTFQIALGLLRVADATAEGFQRAVLFRSRNLVEWSWFGSQPDGAIAASVSPAVVPADGRLPWGYSDSFLVLETGVRYRFELSYTAADRVLAVSVRTGDGLPQPLAPVRLPASFTGFRVDALSVHSYSDAGQDPRFAGSVRASGWVDNLSWTGPDPAVDRILYVGNDGRRQVAMSSRRGWVYRLLASTDLERWVAVGGEVEGTGEELVLEDLRKISLDHVFYRVEARWP